MAKKLSFEEKLQCLEELTEAVRNPELSLEESMNSFEKGIKLARDLEKELEKMEGKIQELRNKPEAASEEMELDLFSGLKE